MRSGHRKLCVGEGEGRPVGGFGEHVDGFAVEVEQVVPGAVCVLAAHELRTVGQRRGSDRPKLHSAVVVARCDEHLRCMAAESARQVSSSVVQSICSAA